MPFSFLSDPVDLARARAAVERVWSRIDSLVIAYHGTSDGEKKAAKIVIGLLTQPVADDDEVRLAVVRFVEPIG